MYAFFLPFIALGRAPEVSTRTQKLKATVCLAEDFPLSLQEQIMPIIDLMVTLVYLNLVPTNLTFVLVFCTVPEHTSFR